MQIIIFKLRDQYYAISTENVEEISKNISITKVPNAPTWVEGLVNLRGNVVTLINLCKLLQQEDSSCYNNIIIIQNEEEKVAIIVEDVVEVVDIEEEDIQKIGEEAADGIIGIIRIKDEIVNIIDINMLISKNEG
ncbi:MAG: chemotaxis protein CheW [Tissierellaceae bacterium]